MIYRRLRLRASRKPAEYPPVFSDLPIGLRGSVVWTASYLTWTKRARACSLFSLRPYTHLSSAQQGDYHSASITLHATSCTLPIRSWLATTRSRMSRR